ncbi:hypothetical protein LTR78_010468 [Recurvomyces mirabilis]|uniref:Uncharacterized protein n=1 Tax=Recurvomyces mirabilis TaxID=574656 RepID=A0AAE0WF23_9PEZI|nr:hypothetical protein LTR78_010468 [Recurvomyces mirabilis]KAK5150361.1 hypothetical protein LTS14_010200 [Recurvomyces mirabilis]
MAGAQAEAFKPEAHGSTSAPQAHALVNCALPSSAFEQCNASCDWFPEPVFDCDDDLARPSNVSSHGLVPQQFLRNNDLISTIQSLSGQIAAQSTAYATLAHAHETLVQEKLQSDQSRDTAIAHGNVLQDQLRQAQCNLAAYILHIEELRRNITSKDDTITVLRDYNRHYTEQQAELTRVLLNIAQSCGSQELETHQGALWRAHCGVSGFPTNATPTAVSCAQPYQSDGGAGPSMLNASSQLNAVDSVLPHPQPAHHQVNNNQDAFLPAIAPRTEMNQNVLPPKKSRSKSKKEVKGQC